MGQYDILQFLEAHKGKEYTILELATEMKQSKEAIGMCVCRLRRYGFIKWQRGLDADKRVRVIYWVE